MILQNIVGGSYVSQNPIADNEETVNWIPEILEAPGGKSRIVLQPTPGIAKFAEAVNLADGCRGTATYAGRCFAVFGARFVEFDAAGTELFWGTVTATDLTPVTISYNGDGGGELFITACNDGFLFDLNTNTFSTIAALADIATMGAMLDGFFLALDAATSTFYISDLYDGATWDPLQFAQRSIASDPWVSLHVTYREIYLIGTATTEIWTFTGAYPFPFGPIPNTLIPYGTSARFSPTLVGGTPMWLTQTTHGQGQVLALDGVAPRVISTRALENEIAQYSTTADAEGQSLEYLGHILLLLTFKTANVTHVYDTTTQIWTKWLEWTGSAYQAWRPFYQTLAFGLLLAGDTDQGILHVLRQDLADQASGTPIRRLRRCPLVFAENQLLYIEYLELFLESGLGLVTGQGSDPQVMLRLSRNGGKTWGSELWRSAGAAAQYGRRVRWNAMGRARDPYLELVMTDPIPWKIVTGFASVELAAGAVA